MGVLLGTAGHIDHGKTALVRALTGTDTDRLPEEKRRGITIDLGFARLDAGGLVISIIDVPGHEAFVRNMLAGATGIDFVLLVIAADEGIMPQTREHLNIVRQLGVRRGVVALTKCDLVEDEWLTLVRADVQDRLADGVLGDAPVLPVSAVTGAGMDELRSALAAAAASVAPRHADDLFRLHVDRVFTARGTGTVVTGTVVSGTLAVDDHVTLLPAGKDARVRALQTHGDPATSVWAGDRAAVALVGIERGEVERGAVLVTDSAWQPTRVFFAQLRLADDAAPLRQRQRVRVHLGAAEVLARVRLIGTDQLDPGNETWARVLLEGPLVPRAGDRFIVRSYSPVITIGGGTVVDPAPRRRRIPERTDGWRAILERDVSTAIRETVRAASWAGIAEHALPILTGARPSELAEHCGALPPGALVRVGTRLVDGELFTRGMRLVVEAVAEVHRSEPLRAGVERSHLRRALPRDAADGLADAAIARAIAAGELEDEAGLLHRAGFIPAAARDQQASLDALLAAVVAAGLATPTPQELAGALPGADVPAMLRFLQQQGAVRLVAPGYFVSRDALGAAAATVTGALAAGPLGPAALREALGVSRKYLIPLLEYFDREGLTAREGDQRVLARR